MEWQNLLMIQVDYVFINISYIKVWIGVWMKFDIELHKHETYNCFDENIISLVCQCYKKDIGIYFLDDFGFCKSKRAVFNLNDPFKISTSCGISDLLLEKYLQIRIEYFRKDRFSYREFRDLLFEEIEKRGLLGISLDSYYCPWNKKYFGVIHMHHYTMIIHADGDMCVCVDPYFSLEQNAIPTRNLYDIVDSLLMFDIGEQNIDYKTVGQIYRKEMINQKATRKEEIAGFAKLLMEQDSEELYHSVGGDINTCGLVFLINSIRKSRCNYRDSLIKYGNNMGFDSAVVDKVLNLCKKWELVQGLCVMAIYKKKNKYLAAASNALFDIAESEEEVIECICS